MANRIATVMKAQFKKATSGPNPYLKFAMSEKDIRTWYILIHDLEGDEGEFVDGQYLVRMVAPKDFPMNPPEFYFMTPNGVYDDEKKVCIHIGVYHKDQYRASLGMSGFANQLCSGMIGWKSLGQGVNLLTTSTEEKANLAANSKKYNERHAKIIATIESTYEAYSAAWEKDTK